MLIFEETEHEMRDVHPDTPVGDRRYTAQAVCAHCGQLIGANSSDSPIEAMSGIINVCILIHARGNRRHKMLVSLSLFDLTEITESLGGRDRPRRTDREIVSQLINVGNNDAQ